MTQRSSASCPRSSYGHPRPRRAPAALRQDLHADSFKGVKYVKTVVNTNLCCTNGGGGVVIGVDSECLMFMSAPNAGVACAMCVFVPSRERKRGVIPTVTRCPPEPVWEPFGTTLYGLRLVPRTWALLCSTATRINGVMTEKMTSSVLLFFCTVLNPCRDISVGHEAVTWLLLKSR